MTVFKPYISFKSHEMDASVHAWLDGLRPGEALRLGALTLWPLCRSPSAMADVDLVHESLDAGTLEIGELAEPEVERVRAVSRGPRPVLILEGESLRGAKQDRVVVCTVLVAAGGSLEVPVGCVERGRWSAGTEGFASAPLPVHPHIREHTSRSRARTGEIDQHVLWQKVGATLDTWGTPSPTACYSDGSARRAEGARRRVRSIEPLPEQVGVLVVRDDRLVGLELLADPALWKRAAPRLLPSYLLDEVEATAEAAPAAGHSADWWLGRLASCHAQAETGVGLGSSFVLAGRGLCGRGLAAEGALLHLAVFGADGA